MRVLIIAAHPDDEAIGMGGQIKLHVEEKEEVEILLLTSGELGCPGMSTEDTMLLRRHEAFKACEVLGSRIYRYLDKPDGDLAKCYEVILDIAQVISERKPQVVYVPNIDDSHVDHQAAARFLKECLDKGFYVPEEVWMYEIWTPFQIYDKLVDITEVIGVKIKAIQRHESQVKRIKFDEAALSLARFRGELHNRPHGPYAEAFKRLRLA